MATARLRFGRTGTFWVACGVLAVCLWAAGSQSLLYPIYAEKWQLTEVVTTAAFATYPSALLLVLLGLGGISDRIGRKRAMLIGVLAVLLSAVVCGLAGSFAWIFVGRALQGIGTGFALSAASAALVEHNPSANPRWASIMTTVSTSFGLVVAAIATGIVVEFLPEPLTTAYVGLFVASVLVLVALAFTPADAREPQVQHSGSMLPRVPRALIRVWAASALACGIAYGLGAAVVSLGADLARELTGTHDALVVGLFMACAFVCVIVASLFTRGMQPRVALIVGILLAAASLVLSVLTAVTASLAVFVVWMVVVEVVFAFAFTGGLGLMNRAAPAQHRAAALSLVFVVSYVFQGGAAVGIGAIATATDLATAMGVSVFVFGAACAGALVLTVWDARAARAARAQHRAAAAGEA